MEERKNQVGSAHLNRRHFGKLAGGLLLTCMLGGQAASLSPAEARKEQVPYSVLPKKTAAFLDRLADTIVPGAAEAGISHYIDNQLAAPDEDTMLIIKYLGVPAPITDFYIAGLKACQNCLEKTMVGNIEKLVSTMATRNPKGWDAPMPASFFYFVLRSDAVDVTYGTMRGFEKLDMPYLAHIEPTETWT